MNGQVKRTLGNRKMFGGVVSVLLFATVACVAQQFGANAGDATGTVPDQKTPDAGDQLTFHEKSECPPDSFLVRNDTDTAKTVIGVCAEQLVAIIRTVEPHSELVFRRSGNCTDHPNCVPCAPTKVIVDGAVVLDCAQSRVYLEAYGIDLAAMGYTITESDLDRPRKAYNSDGDVLQLQYYAIPVIDENDEFVEWEFTTIKPNYSVEDGEVVIRDNRDRVIGDRNGMTLDD